jgi:hypothetical protein
MEILVVLFFGISLLLTFLGGVKSIFFLLIVMALNPISNQIGIFNSPNIALAGLIFIHLIYPFLIFKNLNVIFFDRCGLWFGIFLLHSVIALLVQKSNYPISTISGVKTLVLFLGTYLWIRGLATNIDTNFISLTDRTFLKVVRMASVTILITGQIFNEIYVVDGRLQMGGGFDSAAVLGLFLIILSLHSQKVHLLTTLFDFILGLSLIFYSGSRSGLIAVLIGIFWFILPKFSKFSQRKKQLMSLGLVSSGGIFALLGLVSFNARSFDFLKIFGGNESSQIGTLGFRQQMSSHMINSYLNSDLVTQLIGFGSGSGTWLGGQWLNILLGESSSYTSGRVFHNGMIQILVEQGILGIILFCISCYFCVTQNRVNKAINFRFGWLLLFSIILLLTGNPFSSSGTLTTLAFIPFLSRIRIQEFEKRKSKY